MNEGACFVASVLVWNKRRCPPPQGNTVPTDGVLLKAQGFTVNEASVTGEALPVEKFKGEKLLSGTVATRPALNRRWWKNPTRG